MPFVTVGKPSPSWHGAWAAYGFDACLLTIVLFALAAWLGDDLVDPSHQEVQATLFYHGFAWAYFILFEGLFSATPGKLALQLRVVDSRTGERPRFRNIVLRAAIYLIFSSELPSLIALALNRTSPEAQIIIVLFGTVIGMALLLVTLRPKYGSRLLHDVLSNTIVVAGHDATTPVRLLPTAPLRHVSTTSAAGWPSRFGGYEVSGVIWQSDQQALLQGHDARLNRDVWLLVDRQQQAGINQAERYQPRPARLRYLSHGEQAALYWTAYVAPNGAPLRYWVTPEQPLSWREARLILEQLIEELRHSRDDRTPLNLTSLDQLWLDAQGRISLVDWSLSAPEKETLSVAEENQLANSANVVSPDTQAARSGALRSSEQRFAIEVMRMSLTGKSYPLGAHRSQSSRLCLCMLAIYSSVYEFQMRTRMSVLKNYKISCVISATRPWVVGTTVRLWMMGISMLTILAFVGAMMSISRVANQATLMRLEETWIETSALQAIAADEAWFQEWQGAFANQSPEKRVSSAEMLTAIAEYKQAARAAIQLRWKHAGSCCAKSLQVAFWLKLLNNQMT